jgi:hypothetical protein
MANRGDIGRCVASQFEICLKKIKMTNNQDNNRIKTRKMELQDSGKKIFYPSRPFW